MSKMTPTAVASLLLAAGNALNGSLGKGGDAIREARAQWNEQAKAAQEFLDAQGAEARARNEARSETRDFEIGEITVVSEKLVTAFATLVGDSEHAGKKTLVKFFNDEGAALIILANEHGANASVGEAAQKFELSEPATVSVTGAIFPEKRGERTFWNFHAASFEPVEAAPAPVA